ncbi:MAG TPA: hypothetical protein VN228_02685 [Pyrinomonadaceae bacterium]|nr:hypothetical protein [Pyrinomonadaceae bacterium]
MEFVYAQLRTQATELSDDQSRQLAASLTRQVISEVSALLAAEVALQTTEIAAANTLPLDPKGGR